MLHKDQSNGPETMNDADESKEGDDKSATGVGGCCNMRAHEAKHPNIHCCKAQVLQSVIRHEYYFKQSATCAACGKQIRRVGARCPQFFKTGQSWTGRHQQAAKG